MKGNKEPRGVIATVITPFDEKGNIDYESLEREFQWGVDAGLTGFLVPCGASEIKYLTPDEQVSLFTTARKICGDKLFLMPNLPGPTEEELVAQAKQYMDLGADGININTHWSPRKGPVEEFIHMVKAVDALPQFTGGQFSFEARMGCGFGACMGCTVQTRGGYKRICKEGPILYKEEILW